MMPLLSVQNLRTYFRTRKGWLKAVDGVSFDLEEGESLGIVGESGCGKTTIALTIMRTLPPNAQVMDGKIVLEGQDTLPIPDQEHRRLRWSKVSMIFQAAMNSLNPVFRVGDQLVDVYINHRKVTKDEARKRVAELFELVGLDKKRMNNYPHEFSGGMKQRTIIAMSLLCHPRLIIADEPTTALDVVVQDQILSEIKDLQQELKFSLIVISHDISVISETCDRAIVMYAGRIFEEADIISTIKDPHNPYTISLMSSFPSISGPIRKLVSIPGAAPNLVNPPPGCLFYPRCPIGKEACAKETPPYVQVADRHSTLCHFPHEANKAGFLQVR